MDFHTLRDISYLRIRIWKAIGWTTAQLTCSANKVIILLENSEAMTNLDTERRQRNNSKSGEAANVENIDVWKPSEHLPK